jgi:hypothetical protein
MNKNTPKRPRTLRYYAGLFIALVLLSGAAPAPERLIICLIEISGSRGRNVRVFESGRVVERIYGAAPDARNREFKLRPDELTAIRKVLSDNAFETLPAEVEFEGHFMLDGPSRFLRTSERLGGHNVEWSDFRRRAKTSEGRRFNAIWWGVLAVVDPSR